MSSPAQPVSGNITVTLRMIQSETIGVIGTTVGGGTVSLQELMTVVDAIANAAGGAKTADQMYAEQLTLTGSPTTLHFQTSTAHDPFNNTLAMLRIRLVALQVVTATSGYDVKMYASASDGVSWMPGSAAPVFARANFGMVLIYDPNSNGSGVGNAITSTTDGITLDPGGNTVVVNFMVVGTSVA